MLLQKDKVLSKVKGRVVPFILMGKDMERNIVGFLTDFGLSDPYVGQVKAVMLSLNPRLEIIDLGHLIKPFCVICGAYSLYSSVNYFRRGSGILAVVDPGVGSSRRALISEIMGRIIVGPDNGLLWQLVEDNEDSRVYEIDRTVIEKELEWQVSSTFHGRDLFGPALAIALREGSVDSVAARRIDKNDMVKLPLRRMEREGGKTCFNVVYVDRFGNIALSATLKDFELPEKGTHLKLITGSNSVQARVLPTFSLAERGEVTVYFNSFGFLEVAVNQGSASARLGVSVGDRLCLEKAM